MKKLAIALVLVLLCAGASWGTAEFLAPWGYVWVNASHYRTNLKSDDFNSYLGRGETKIGVNLLPLWADAAIQPYFAYYGVASDDKHSWNNNNVIGGGVQIMPFKGIKEADFLQDLKIYAESLQVTWMPGMDDGDPTDSHYKTDSRLGFDLWHEWNLPSISKVEDTAMPWGELWTNLSYRSTNFNYDGFGKFDNYVFFFQPKVGIYAIKLFESISIEPYLAVNAVVSGREAKEVDEEYAFFNNVESGIGVRVRPFSKGYFLGGDVKALRKLTFFIETFAVSYLKDRGPVDHDMRFGVDFSIGR